jgi:hypothetical protein
LKIKITGEFSMRITRVKFGLLLILLLSGVVFAQNSVWQENKNLDVVLLKKDLGQLIKESESSPSVDSQTLLRMLNLYYRAANYPKIAATVKQIIAAPDLEKNRINIAETVKYFIKSDFFQDAEILRLYLQKINFDGEIFGKFADLCYADQQNCDVGGFDDWLKLKAQEKSEKDDFSQTNWTGIRIDWHKKFNLDNTEIFNQFIDAVRENPSDLDTALRYLKYLRSSSEALWLSENFNSKRAFDYYQLGETIAPKDYSLSITEDENRFLARAALVFLQKSISLPFADEDIKLIGAYKFRYVSMPPRVGNYEKQLRFWTKKEIAKVYRLMGEPQNAQPIIEELNALDKSDIVETDVSYISGAVQAQSGARVIESKILREQATRQDSTAYWFERIEYYRGRNETERMFDAYKQMLTIIPFDMNDKRSRENRLDSIRRFAGFVEDEFGGYTDKNTELDEREKQKLLLWKDAENFLRNEFGKNSARLKYSYDLAQVIGSYDFDELLVEIFDKNSQMLLDAFVNLDVESYYYHDLFSDFLGKKAISKVRKDAFVNQFEKLAANAAPRKILFFCRLLIENGLEKNYAVRSIPLLRKHLDKTEVQLNPARLSEKKSLWFKYEKKQLVETLFRAYLANNDWKAAENLLVTKYQDSISESLGSVSVSAARNNAFDDAVRIWKIRANLNRQNLNYLASLKSFPAVREGLREYYRQMKESETYSLIPDMALAQLN